MQSRIQRSAEGLAISIPQSLADDLGLVEDGSVELVVDEGKLIIELSHGPSLAELLRGVNDTNLHSEHDWGVREGKEAW